MKPGYIPYELATTEVYWVPSNSIRFSEFSHWNGLQMVLNPLCPGDIRWPPLSFGVVSETIVISSLYPPNHWVGLRENLNWKPFVLPPNIRLPLIFPLNQFTYLTQILLQLCSPSCHDEFLAHRQNWGTLQHTNVTRKSWKTCWQPELGSRWRRNHRHWSEGLWKWGF